MKIPFVVNQFEASQDDSYSLSLDLNKKLVQNPAATFIVQATKNSKNLKVISEGDIFIVDQSLQPRDRDVVLAVENGSLTIKQLALKNLLNTEVVKTESESSFEIRGVVTSIIHILR